MEIFINVADKSKFIKMLCSALETTIMKYQLECIDNLIYISCRYFDGNVLGSEDTDLECIREDFNVHINTDLWINIYSKSYCEGIREIIKILNWIIKNIETDIVLLDEQSHLIFSLADGQIYLDNDYPNFPFEELELGLN